MNGAARDTGARRGQALAEFALAIPIFLLLLFGLLDVGRFVVAQNALANAAREGARLAVVNQDAASIEARVLALSFLSAPVVAPPVFLESVPALTDANLDDNDRCGPGEDRALAVGCVALIRVTTALEPLTPVVGQLLGPITLGATAMQPVELVCPNAAIEGFASASSCPKQP